MRGQTPREQPLARTHRPQGAGIRGLRKDVRGQEQGRVQVQRKLHIVQRSIDFLLVPSSGRFWIAWAQHPLGGRLAFVGSPLLIVLVTLLERNVTLLIALVLLLATPCSGRKPSGGTLTERALLGMRPHLLLLAGLSLGAAVLAPIAGAAALRIALE